MVFLAQGSLGRGTRCTDFKKQSNMDIMQVLPSDGDRPVAKSTAIWDHGWRDTGRGLKRPADGRLSTLQWVQMLQAVKNLEMSLHNMGHQN